MSNIKHYISAAFPAIAVETYEEERCIKHVMRELPEYNVFALDTFGEVTNLRTGDKAHKASHPREHFKWLANQPRNTILFVCDLQHTIKNPQYYRAIKEISWPLKRLGSTIILLAPSWQLPEELKHDVPVLQFNLPDRQALNSALDVITRSTNITVDDTIRTQCLDAATGLTIAEAENAFALSLIKDKALNPQNVLEEKMRLVRQSGYLQIYQPVTEQQLGGLGELKKYFREQVLPAADDPQLRVKGILLVGVPGTGKSLASKVAGSLLNWPVLGCDLGSLKGSYVGQSEANMRNVLKLADAIAPTVLFFDEFEKAVGGYASSAQTDGGTTLGMLGILLTWFQETTSPVLVMASCNDFNKLPVELIRRFDEKFFVDLPTSQERLEIATIHLKRLNLPIKFAHKISELTPNWSGAEIENLIKSAARLSKCNLTEDALRQAATYIKPIAITKPKDINALRDWASTTLRLANTPEEFAFLEDDLRFLRGEA